MIFKIPAPNLKGLRVVDLQAFEDARGSFAVAWNRKAFREEGLHAEVDQVNFSTSRAAGTFRGLHYQIAPYEQTKTVFCVRGRIMDVAVDVRPDSPTYLQHFGVRLDPACGPGLYVPPGFAHGWYSIHPDSQIVYLVRGMWSKEHERGLRYDDPALKICLPGDVSSIQDRDANWPLIDREPA